VYCASNAAQWDEVEPTCDAQWPLPNSVGHFQVYFESLPAHWPAQGVIKLDRGRLIGPHGLLFDSSRTRLPWHSWHRNANRPPKITRSQWNASGAFKIRGTALSIMSEFSDRNYCHFTFDCLPRVNLFRRSRFANESLDAIIVPGKYSQKHEATYKALGFNPEKLVWYGETQGVCADVLIATTFPGVARCYPPWAIRFIREFYRQEFEGKATRHRRLYISRQGFARDIENLSEIETVLEKHGIESFEPHRAPDVKRCFAEAELIVGAHGAGLADVAFCARGTKVLEFVPETNCYPYFYSIAVNSGCEYSAIVARTVDPKAHAFGVRSKSNVRVCPEELDLALTSMEC
jgi:capsular polysaccharide biosynthesis protein